MVADFGEVSFEDKEKDLFEMVRSVFHLQGHWISTTLFKCGISSLFFGLLG